MRVRDLRKQKKGLGPCPGQGEDLRRDCSNVCGLLLEFNVLFRNYKASVKIVDHHRRYYGSFIFKCTKDTKTIQLRESYGEIKN